MGKKIPSKKAEKILDIQVQQEQSEVNSFDILQRNKSDTSLIPVEDDIKIKYEQRKKEVEKIQKTIHALKDLGDDEFVKQTLKELTSIGMGSLHQMQEEMLNDPSGRMGECMAALSNSIVAALKQISDMNKEKQKIELEREKVEMKKQVIQQSKNISSTNNVVVIGSISDALNLIKNNQKENESEIVVKPENISNDDNENNKRE